MHYPVFDKDTIITTDLLPVHKSVIIKAYDAGYNNAMIFQNELYFIRNLGDINNNEVKTFLGTNTTWDMLILSPNAGLSTSSYLDYVHVKKVNRTDFHFDQVYLVSRRLMEKIKLNSIADVETYLYSNPFVNSIVDNSTTHNVSICKVSDIVVVKDEVIKYKWSRV